MKKWHYRRQDTGAQFTLVAGTPTTTKNGDGRWGGLADLESPWTCWHPPSWPWQVAAGWSPSAEPPYAGPPSGGHPQGTHLQITHTPANHAHTCKSRTHLQTMHSPTNHAHTCKPCTHLQIMHTPENHAHTCKSCTHLQVTILMPVNHNHCLIRYNCKSHCHVVHTHL